MSKRLYRLGPAEAWLIDTIRAHPGEVRLLAVGRMTNLARAVQMAPDIAGLVRDVVIMGGGLVGLTLALQLKKRFADIDVLVLERRAEPTTDRALAPLHRLVSDDVVVPPAMMRVCEDVAERSAGSDTRRHLLKVQNARAMSRRIIPQP